MVPGSVVLDREMTPGLVRLYAVLALFRNGKMGQAWPSVETLSDLSGLGRRHVQRGLRRIEEIGHIRSRRVIRQEGGYGWNVYSFPRDAVPTTASGDAVPTTASGKGADAAKTVPDDAAKTVPDDAVLTTAQTDSPTKRTNINPLGASSRSRERKSSLRDVLKGKSWTEHIATRRFDPDPHAPPNGKSVAEEGQDLADLTIGGSESSDATPEEDEDQAVALAGIDFPRESTKACARCGAIFPGPDAGSFRRNGLDPVCKFCRQREKRARRKVRE